jgi:hypothetical protein
MFVEIAQDGGLFVERHVAMGDHGNLLERIERAQLAGNIGTSS